MKIKNNYQTKDIGEASALLCKGAKLKSLQPEGRTFWFVFQDFNISSELSRQYWYENLEVNARDYHNNIKLLKGRIFNH